MLFFVCCEILGIESWCYWAILSPFIYILFWNRFSLNFPEWSWTWDPPGLAYGTVEITNVCHLASLIWGSLMIRQISTQLHGDGMTGRKMSIIQNVHASLQIFPTKLLPVCGDQFPFPPFCSDFMLCKCWPEVFESLFYLYGQCLLPEGNDDCFTTKKHLDDQRPWQLPRGFSAVS